MSRLDTGIGVNSVKSTTGFTPAEDVEKEGFLRGRQEEGKFRLYWMQLTERELLWYSTQRPPDRAARPGDVRHTILLKYYRIDYPADDIKKLHAFSLTPSHDAPHGQEDYDFVAANEADCNTWKDLLAAACLGGAIPTASLFASSVPNLTIDVAAAHRSGFLYQKMRGTDWRAWNLRWCVLSGTPPTLSWAKPPKVGKDTVKAEGDVDIEGARIHCGRDKTPAKTFFRVQPASGTEILFAAGSRFDAVEWVHILQYLAGHLVGEEAKVTEAEGAAQREASLAAQRGVYEQQATRISKLGYLHFKQSSRNTWCTKLLWLRNNELHWFEPPIPGSTTLTSDDAVMLNEPFALQGAPQHALSGSCLSILTAADRFFLSGTTDGQIDSWQQALQLVWHCMRGSHPEAMQAQDLTSRIDEHLSLTEMESQVRHLGFPDSKSPITAGLLHWRTSGRDWQLTLVGIQGSQLCLHEPGAQPGVVGASKENVSLDQSAEVTPLPGALGIHGFVVTVRRKKKHEFATADEQATTRWAASIRAAIATSPEAEDWGADDLDELDGLDIPIADQDLAALDTLDIDVPIEVEEPTGILQGLLEKKGTGKLGKWQMRFFVLSKQSLSYFEQHGDQNSKKGEFLLRDVTAVRPADGSDAAFMVGLADQMVNLRAKTRREADMWVGAITELLDNVGTDV